MGIYFPLPSSYNSKNHNKRVILDIIRFSPGGTSRAELARQIGLTRAAVTTIVSDILDNGLVRELDGGPATGGRRPILLEMNPGRGYVVGIDMGATHLGITLADLGANVIHEIEKPYNIDLGPKICLEQVNGEMNAIIEEAGCSLSNILAVGIGVPGPVIFEAGLVSAPPIMPGWDGYPIRKHLQDLWQIPVTVSNDAEMGALGEWAYGAGRGERNLAYIKVGSGVGAGLLVDGRIYRGATGSAGEIGHITIHDEGPLCSCGNRGCLEALSGGKAIAQKAKDAVRAGRRTQLSTTRPIDSITAYDVATAARMGDLVSQQIIAEAGMYLGIALASLVNLFNPSIVVVGGGVAQVGDLLLEPVRKAIRERSLRSSAQAVQVTSSVLGRRSSSMGAVVQAVNIALHQIVGV